MSGTSIPMLFFKKKYIYQKLTLQLDSSSMATPRASLGSDTTLGPAVAEKSRGTLCLTYNPWPCIVCRWWFSILLSFSSRRHAALKFSFNVEEYCKKCMFLYHNALCAMFTITMKICVYLLKLNDLIIYPDDSKCSHPACSRLLVFRT